MHFKVMNFTDFLLHCKGVILKADFFDRQSANPVPPWDLFISIQMKYRYSQYLHEKTLRLLREFGFRNSCKFFFSSAHIFDQIAFTENEDFKEFGFLRFRNLAINLIYLFGCFSSIDYSGDYSFMGESKLG